jgi:hypothetical protein
MAMEPCAAIRASVNRSQPLGVKPGGSEVLYEGFSLEES